MPGLNHVGPSGEPLTLPLSPTATGTKISVGPMDNNAYLLQPSDGAAVLVDAADDPERLLGLIGKTPVRAIVTTHRHRDHWQALPAVARATDALLLAGTPDVAALRTDTGLTTLAGLWDGDRVELGGEWLEVIGLVGHTPGSIALAYRGEGPAHLFTGDSLFPGGPGRTTSGQDFNTLIADLETKIFDRFPDETVVHPGHGDDTTLGAERAHLAEWRARGW